MLWHTPIRVDQSFYLVLINHSELPYPYYVFTLINRQYIIGLVSRIKLSRFQAIDRLTGRNTVPFSFCLEFTSVNQVGERYIRYVFITCNIFYVPVISLPVREFSIPFHYYECVARHFPVHVRVLLNSKSLHPSKCLCVAE